MSKVKTRLGSIIFWSVISAAFIGPGTLTTASVAGAEHKLALLWGLGFATVACIALQEAAARLTINSGVNLGQAIVRRYGTSQQRFFKIAVFAAIAFGCAAYEAGNILGAISGLQLLIPWNGQLLTALVGIMCFVLLLKGSFAKIAGILSILVAIMGLAFIAIALRQPTTMGEVVTHLLKPSIPHGSAWLLLALVGTTIVPYNLFMGSGISGGQGIGTMRFGLTGSILLGGVTSMAILISAIQINEPLTFPTLAKTLQNSLGDWALYLMAAGLFAAGFTSSVTAPLASAVLVKNLFQWEERSRAYRATWIVVLGIGFIFGIADIKPIPIIVAAQALNGLLLPLIAILIIFLINDPRIMPATKLNNSFSNLLLLTILTVILVLGFNNVNRALELWPQTDSAPYLITASIVISILVGLKCYRSRTTR